MHTAGKSSNNPTERKQVGLKQPPIKLLQRLVPQVHTLIFLINTKLKKTAGHSQTVSMFSQDLKDKSAYS